MTDCKPDSVPYDLAVILSETAELIVAAEDSGLYETANMLRIAYSIAEREAKERTATTKPDE